MSDFYNDLLAVFDKYGVGLPPHLAHQLYNLNVPPAQTATTPAPSAPAITPDDGFVVVIGITNPDYANCTHQIKENTDALTPGTFAKGSAERNLELANGRYVTTGFIGVGEEVEQFTNTTTGQPDWRLKQPQVLKPNTYTWPAVIHQGHDLGTVAGVRDWVNSLPPRVTNDGTGFHG